MSLEIDYSEKPISLETKEQTQEALKQYLSMSFQRKETRVLRDNLRGSSFLDKAIEDEMKFREEQVKKYDTPKARKELKYNELSDYFSNLKFGKGNDHLSEKEKDKAETRGVLSDFKGFDHCIKAVVAGGLVVTAGLAAAGVAKLGGVDPTVVSMAIIKATSLGSAVMSAGGLTLLGRKALSAAYVNKGGRELFEAEENLNSLKCLKDVLHRDQIREEQDKTKKSLQGSIMQVANKQKAVQNQVIASKIMSR
ncbi:MAG: hypothetical protein MJ250_08065 [Alphaproteobacteria bacterium]|nr:hypothetical protein [Alphaproteobacteria bacterium]